MREFKSDGCSLFFNGDWVKCCYLHDKAYWRGGTRRDRRIADTELMRCVAAKDHPVIAILMYIGVRIGGVGFFPTPFRWGFGYTWPKCKM